MSITSIQSNIQRFQRELAELEKQLAQESKKEVDKNSRINQVRTSITKNISLSTLNSKTSEMSRLAGEVARIQANKASIGRKIADKTQSLHKEQQALTKEQENERRKIADTETRLQRAQLDRQKAITNELRTQRRLTEEIQIAPMPPNQFPAAQQVKKYDLFISHASEDKKDFVEPLVKELTARGVEVWLDVSILRVGDSLRQSIDKGLVNSQYGVVVLSSAFFAKNWPQYELNGLVAREMEGVKVILPIWHKVSKDEVMSFSPTLADKIALNSSISSISEIADQLAEVLSDS